MLQLIIVVISIALVAAIALAAVFFGGQAFSEGTIKAKYAQNVNTATQIEAALQLYFQDYARYPSKIDGPLLQELHDLTYLKEVPAGDWKVQPDSLYKTIEIQSVSSCKAMNKVAGFDVSIVPAQYEGCPPCNGAEGTQQLADAQTFKAYPGCQFVP